MQENNVALSNDLVVAAVKKFHVLLLRGANKKELQFSHEWVQDFKKRYNIKGYTRHGEDASANFSKEVLKKMEDIKTLVSQYRSCDVFNMDETGLFYRLEPNHTLATKRLFGKKIEGAHHGGTHCKCLWKHHSSSIGYQSILEASSFYK